MILSVKYQYGYKTRTNSTNRMITDAWDSMQRKVCNSRNIILQSSSILANIRSKLKLLYVNKSLKLPKE